MEFKEVDIYSEKLKFPVTFDVDLLQSKLDLLFTTMRLMGYSIKEYFGVDPVAYGFDIFSITAEKENKKVSLVFGLYRQIVVDMEIEGGDYSSIFVVLDAVELVSDGKKSGFTPNNLEEIKEKLDEILVYI